MKYLFKIALIILIISPVSLASIDEIINNGMFGCHIISDSIPGVDEYITAITLKEMDKDSNFMSIYKTPRGKPEITIDHRFRFSEFPDLLMFSNFLWRTGSSYRYEAILFNESDSSIYYFDGNPKNFSEVMQNYLGQIRTEEQIVSFLNLYFNSIYVDGSQYLLRSMGDFLSICDSLGNLFKVDLKEKMKYDIKEVEKVIEPYSHSYINGIHEIECYVWDIMWRRLYKYQIKLSKHNFEIPMKKLVLENVGPFGISY